MFYLIRVKEDGSYTVSPEYHLIFEENKSLEISDEVKLMWTETYKKAGKTKTRTREFTGVILNKGEYSFNELRFLLCFCFYLFDISLGIS